MIMGCHDDYVLFKIKYTISLSPNQLYIIEKKKNLSIHIFLKKSAQAITPRSEY